MEALSRWWRCLRGPRWRMFYLVVVIASCALNLTLLSYYFEGKVNMKKTQIQPDLLHHVTVTNSNLTESDERGLSIWETRVLAESAKRKRKSAVIETPHRIFQDGIGFVKQTLNSHIKGYDNFLGNTSADQVVFHYPPFNVSSPRFLEEADRDQFWGERLNAEFARETETKHLTGKVVLIRDGVFGKHVDCGWSSNLERFRNRRTSESAKYDQMLINFTQAALVCPLLVPESDSFQHFIDGAIPKLLQALPFLLQNGVKLVLFDYGRNGVVRDILERLLLKDDNILLVNPSRFQTTVAYQLNTCIAPPLHPVLVQTLHSLTGAPWTLGVPMTSAHVILLNRFTAHNPGRRILNYHDLSAFLSNRYGNQYRQFIQPKDLSSSINLFGRARMIIGVHGGAFYNLNFSPRETAIVEIMPLWEGKLPVLAHSIVWRMADALGQEYWRLNNPALDYDCNVNVNITKLRMTLDIIDRKQLSLK